MKPRSSLVALPVLLALGAVACGGTDKTDVTGNESTEGDDAGGGSAKGPNGPCDLHTTFAGDDKCIEPPAEEDGLQIHVGPTDYENPDEVWVMQPGEESTQCYYTQTTNDVDHYYFKQQWRMRPGSHHMIVVTSDNPDAPEGWGKCETSIVKTIGGTQHTVEDVPAGGVIPPEDEGLGHVIFPHTPLEIQLHFYNNTDAPTLREAWANLLYKPADEVTQPLGMVGGLARINVPPGEKVQTSASCKADNAIPATEETRIFSLYGHAHSHTTRFNVDWLHADGTRENVYDNYEWSEGPTYTYNTVVQNPERNEATRRSGGMSGMLIMKPGDSLEFTCDIHNDDLANTLTFGNEVFTKEMCNLFGSVAALGLPCNAFLGAKN